MTSFQNGTINSCTEENVIISYLFFIPKDIGDEDILLVTYMGFHPQELKVGSQTTINVILKEDSKVLDEVVVIGYGSTSKRSLTTSVATIDAGKMKNIPTSSVSDGLAGRAAGLIVTQSGGGLGKKSQISIRGGGTPIVVIDGIVSPYSDFENLNSDDIESLSILKDAAAAAVYGARAGDGVIVIKTKAGENGLKVDYSFNQNFSKPTYLAKKIGSHGLAQIDNTIRDVYNLDPRWTPEEIDKFRTGSDPYNYPNVDWHKVMLRSLTPETKHSISLRGGSEFNKYYVSFQAYDQESMYTTKTDWLKRYNVRMGETTEFKDIGLTLRAGVDAYIINTRSPRSAYSSGYGFTWSHIQNMSPMDLDRNKYGQLAVGVDHPLSEISPESGYTKNDGKMINGTFSADWNVYGVEGLKLKAGGNYRYWMNNSKSWNKTALQYDQEGSVGPSLPISLNYGNTNDRQYTLQFFADYVRSFNGSHNISLTGGYEQTYGFGTSIGLLRKNYLFMIDQIGAGPSNTMENSGREYEFGRAGFVGRASYNYKNKYYAEGSLRHDGSDLFPKDKRWGTFFAGSLAYSISEENFFEPLKELNILNFFKLRATYGEVGLDAGVSPFSYLTSYSLNERGYVVDGKLVPSFSEGALISDDITWYTRNTIDIGFDFSSLNERLAGSFDYFYMKTTGYLTSPSNVGYTDPLGLSLPKVKSDGEHRRAGFDMSLSWKDKVGDIDYEIGGNFIYFDQLVSRAWDEDIVNQKNPWRRQVQQKGYWGIGHTNNGYYNNSDDVMNNPRRDGSTGIVAGDIKYQDQNGDGFIDENDKRRIGKSGFPRGNYGIHANLSYKGFFTNILFQGATSRDMYLDDVVRGQSTKGYTILYPYQLDYWMPDNRDAQFPRLAMSAQDNGNNNYETSDFWMVNGRYIRLKTLQVGYDLRTSVLKNVNWIKKLEVVLSGHNLFTISPATKYGLDPENGSTNNYDYPVQRVYAISVNLGF